MTIALVYDLREDWLAQGLSHEEVAEFDSIETIDLLAEALERASGARIERVGQGRALAARLIAGVRYDLVFSIAEGRSGRNREAQVPALCEMFDQPYVFSDPLTLSVSLDKAVAKRLVREAGLRTTTSLLLSDADGIADSDLAFPLFVKPNSEGTGKGCERASLVRNAAELRHAVSSVMRRFSQPALVEPYLAGREFTVGILGEGEAAHVIAVMEIFLGRNAEPGIYSFLNKEEFETRVTYGLAEDDEAREAGELALAAYRTLGCRDAGRVDIRSNEKGMPHFMEINPLAGLHPTRSDLPILARLAGIGYERLIGEILEHACRRQGIDLPVPMPRLVATA
ncbi:MAG: D-alanine--D-alanine ligase [Rhodothalassiaceae bacterium]